MEAGEEGPGDAGNRLAYIADSAISVADAVITLQELIARGRFLMAEAPSRLKVFEAVDGRSTAREIASATGRHENNVRRDLATLRDAELVRVRLDSTGKPIERDGMPVYEQVPLARSIPRKYFKPTSKRPETAAMASPRTRSRRSASKQLGELRVPDENEILSIARHGEDQLYEFKAPAADVGKIVREIAAMLNTSQGGMVFYGIEDDGTIIGAGTSRQDFDQPLQNSIRSSIAPAAVVKLHSASVLGSDVLVIIVPPWNRSDVYQFGERILIRKGTNVFAARPEEVRRLHRGEIIV